MLNHLKWKYSQSTVDSYKCVGFDYSLRICMNLDSYESYHTYKKEEELFELQDEIQKLKSENQNLKEKLSEVLNQNFNLTGQETFTVEDPNPTFESMAPETQAPPGGGLNLAELEDELMKAKDENEDLISKNHLLEDQVHDLNFQIKKLKKVSNLRKSQ